MPTRLVTLVQIECDVQPVLCRVKCGVLLVSGGTSFQTYAAVLFTVGWVGSPVPVGLWTLVMQGLQDIASFVEYAIRRRWDGVIPKGMGVEWLRWNSTDRSKIHVEHTIRFSNVPHRCSYLIHMIMIRYIQSESGCYRRVLETFREMKNDKNI